jgi:hypothetical protein
MHRRPAAHVTKEERQWPVEIARKICHGSAPQARFLLGVASDKLQTTTCQDHRDLIFLSIHSLHFFHILFMYISSLILERIDWVDSDELARRDLRRLPDRRALMLGAAVTLLI